MSLLLRMLTLDCYVSLCMCSLLPYVAHSSRAIDANWLLSLRWVVYRGR
jgi:hypothetical protein